MLNLSACGHTQASFAATGRSTAPNLNFSYRRSSDRIWWRRGVIGKVGDGCDRATGAALSARPGTEKHQAVPGEGGEQASTRTRVIRVKVEKGPHRVPFGSAAPGRVALCARWSEGSSPSGASIAPRTCMRSARSRYGPHTPRPADDGRCPRHRSGWPTAELLSPPGGQSDRPSAPVAHRPSALSRERRLCGGLI